MFISFASKVACIIVKLLDNMRHHEKDLLEDTLACFAQAMTISHTR